MTASQNDALRPDGDVHTRVFPTPAAAGPVIGRFFRGGCATSRSVGVRTAAGKVLVPPGRVRPPTRARRSRTILSMWARAVS